MNMRGPIAQGALAAAKKQIHAHVPEAAADPEHVANAVCEWAVGAAFRYLVSATEARPATAEREQQRTGAKPSPTDLGGDPKDIAKAKGFTGDMCSSCGGLNMVRTGTCTTCQDCGGTSGGCS